MRKFVRKKTPAPEVFVGRAEDEPSSSQAHLLDYREPGENLRVRNALDQLRAEHSKLKEATQRLLSENIELKERLKHSEENGPNLQETQRLNEIVSQENDYLLQQVREEQAHLRDLKMAHMSEIDRLSADLDACQIEKSAFEKRFDQLRMQNDKMQTEIKLIAEEQTHVIPVATHQEAIGGLHSLLKELRNSYNSHLADFFEQTKSSQSDLRRIALEVAKSNAELLEYKRRNQILIGENDQLKQRLVSLEAQLVSAVEAKTEAENTLRDLLKVTELQAEENRGLTEKLKQ